MYSHYVDSHTKGCCADHNMNRMLIIVTMAIILKLFLCVNVSHGTSMYLNYEGTAGWHTCYFFSIVVPKLCQHSIPDISAPTYCVAAFCYRSSKDAILICRFLENVAKGLILIPCSKQLKALIAKNSNGKLTMPSIFLKSGWNGFEYLELHEKQSVQRNENETLKY